MNNRVNYSLVGFLVLLSLILMLGFGYWLLKPSAEEEMQKYLIRFDESVLGLNLDAPVKFRGISVGKVVNMKINPKNSEQVEILVDILKTTPVKSSTVAKLTSQGITGLSYINLSQGDNKAPLLKASKEEEFPVIQTSPSLFFKLEDTFGDVTTDLSGTLLRMQQLLNEENQQEITLLLRNSAVFMSKMNKTFDDETIRNFQASMKNLNSSTKKLDEMMPRIEKFINNSVEWEDKISSSFKSITGSYHGIRTTMDDFREAMARGDFNLKEITGDLVPTMNSTFVEMQELMIKMQEAIDKYERSPGDILFKQEKIKKGPGED
ncbi:MAG: MlaD family protein [Sulfurimonas sp.]|uniref:MlaD family protein n=1 Tax=Sulfurimonas sp. TaxID=2022749 RepID=UPI00262E8EF4|nr:MlaD family protein [Sulfurimonas sp.]MCW8895261.1 MlaD family protein [Sulfurimonas sp.]MCW8953340.1 MlaD family protein [Sulfurimonas sp.]